MVTYSTLLDMMQHQWVIGSQHLRGMLCPHLQRCLLSVTCWSFKMRAMYYLAMPRFNSPFTQCHMLEEWSTHHAICLVLWFSYRMCIYSCTNCIFSFCTADLL